MKQEIQVNTQALKSAINFVTRLKRSPNFPVTAQVLIKSENRLLTLSTTDIQAWVQIQIPIESDAKVAVLVSSEKLLALEKATAETVKLTFEETRLTIKSAKSIYKLATSDSADFPEMSEISNSHSITLDTKVFLKAIKKVAHAVARNDIRYYLNGIALQFLDNAMVLVATNGHQLAKEEVILDESFSAPINVILCGNYISLLMKLCDEAEIHIEISGQKINVVSGNTTCQLPLLEGKFPDWRRVIPKKRDNRMVVGKAALIDSINRVSFCSTESTAVVLTGNGTDSLTITSKDTKADNQIEDTIDAINSQINIGISADYLSGAIAAIEDDDVEVYSGDAMEALLILDQKSPSFAAVIMPIRV